MLIKSRRSFRSYKKQDVPSEKISKLIEMLAYPPTGSNVDTLHFSIVGTAEKMRAISKFTYEKMFAVENPSPIMQFCKAQYEKGADYVYRGAPSMIAVSVNKAKAIAGCENADPIIALSYFELYAQSLGLGTLKRARSERKRTLSNSARLQKHRIEHRQNLLPVLFARHRPTPV